VLPPSVMAKLPQSWEVVRSDSSLDEDAKSRLSTLVAEMLRAEGDLWM
jgi:hypothetical protein